jgi:hypothetical protein
MRKPILIIISVCFNSIVYGQNWTLIKDTISPTNELTLEFDSIYKQPLSTLGWEDGLHISNDGLNLYCTYLPIDFLSFVLNGELPNNFSSSYLRGAPDFGMDLITNPIGSTEWLHSDILYAHRNTLSDSFNLWTLSDMSRNFYSEGAPTPAFVNNTNSVEFMMFTSNDNVNNNTDIWVINNTLENPSGIGTPMPSPINTLNNEDNPHLVRIDNNNLVLVYDSDNLPGGTGDFDIWFSTSADNGTSWTAPSEVNTINTTNKEHQPFLHQNFTSGNWFLYYSAYHTDGKLAIFRVQQITPNNWNSWGASELVISAGNSAGIGEPTLTKNGDISFVLIYEDPNSNSIYNHFDSDPWFLQKKNMTTGINEKTEINAIQIYPNPTSRKININTKQIIKQVKIYNSIGQLCLASENTTVDLIELSNGIYYLTIELVTGEIERKKLIKQ